MKRLLLASATLLALAAVTPAFALLSPLWQSAAEMKKILSSNAVGDALKSQDPIVSVTRTGVDRYEVSNGTCTVPVTVSGDATSGDTVGPRKFSIEVGEASCK
jgi:hypothetical protein